jgi:hypothetical protein
MLPFEKIQNKGTINDWLCSFGWHQLPLNLQAYLFEVGLENSEKTPLEPKTTLYTSKM